jgi:hypothetical protein
MSEQTGKTAQEAYQALTKGLREKLEEFKESLNPKTEYSAKEAAFAVKESIREQISEFEDSLVKMRAIENGEKLEKRAPAFGAQRQDKDRVGNPLSGAWSSYKKRKYKKEEVDKAEDLKFGPMKPVGGFNASDAVGHRGTTYRTTEHGDGKYSLMAHHPTGRIAQEHLGVHNSPEESAVAANAHNAKRVGKAEPGPTTSSAPLQIGHGKPTVPTSPADKHPKPQPALPIRRDPPESEVAAQGPLKKELYGLPGPAPTGQQMSQQLGKNVFQIAKMCKTNEVINTTFKAEAGGVPVVRSPKDKPYKHVDHKPVANPNATTKIAGKDITDTDRARYERESLELHHKEAHLPSDSLPEDKNQKDTGAGGQISKGKLKKDDGLPVKPRVSPTLVAPPKYKSPVFAAMASQSHTAPHQAQTMPTQAPVGAGAGTINQRPPHAGGAAGGTKIQFPSSPVAKNGAQPMPTHPPSMQMAQKPMLPGVGKAGGQLPKLPMAQLPKQTLANKNHAMPAQQQSVKPNLGPTNKGGVNGWE